jgi:hypothetical protein
LSMVNCSSIFIKNSSFKGFENGIKQTGSKGKLFKITNSEFENNQNGLVVDAQNFKIEHSSFYHNEKIGLQLNSNYKDAMLKSIVFYNNATAVSIDEKNLISNHKTMIYDCHFYNNQLAVVSKFNQLTLNCCLFDNNLQSIYSSNSAVSMSKNVSYNGYWGSFPSGNCTFKHKSNKNIELEETAFNISNGNNNFIYNGSNSNYQFIVGSIQLDVNSLYPNSFDLNVSQNYWSPKPNIDWSKEVGRFYNINFFNPILGSKSTFFRGINQNQINTSCYNTNNQSIVADSNEQCLLDSIKESANKHQYKLGLKIYPLPASEFLKVSGLMELKINKVIIINTNGQSQSEFEVETNDLQIDVRQYSDGIYYMVYEIEGEIAHQLFTVMHR